MISIVLRPVDRNGTLPAVVMAREGRISLVMLSGEDILVQLVDALELACKAVLFLYAVLHSHNAYAGFFDHAIEYTHNRLAELLEICFAASVILHYDTVFKIHDELQNKQIIDYIIHQN